MRNATPASNGHDRPGMLNRSHRTVAALVRSTPIDMAKNVNMAEKGFLKSGVSWKLHETSKKKNTSQKKINFHDQNNRCKMPAHRITSRPRCMCLIGRPHAS